MSIKTLTRPQYQLVKLLTNQDQNIAVVGDDWQCLLPGTLVHTEQGNAAIETIDGGHIVQAAAGYGSSGFSKVLRRRQFSYSGQVYRITTESKKELVLYAKSFTIWPFRKHYPIFCVPHVLTFKGIPYRHD